MDDSVDDISGTGRKIVHGRGKSSTKSPPPSGLVCPPAPWGRWQPVLGLWVRLVRSRVRPEDQPGAFQAVALLRQLLDLTPTSDNAGKPATVLREPGQEG